VGNNNCCGKIDQVVKKLFPKAEGEHFDCTVFEMPTDFFGRTK
jgi:hypothetical protein